MSAATDLSASIFTPPLLLWLGLSLLQSRAAHPDGHLLRLEIFLRNDPEGGDLTRGWCAPRLTGQVAGCAKH